jgi:hypothetical protein
LKSNQGIRQWLYIIAGVLFFGTFFCTSKRKYIKKEEKLIVMQGKNINSKVKPLNAALLVLYAGSFGNVNVTIR